MAYAGFCTGKWRLQFTLILLPRLPTKDDHLQPYIAKHALSLPHKQTQQLGDGLFDVWYGVEDSIFS